MAASSAPEKLWEPGERAVEEAQLTQFARQLVRKRGADLDSDVSRASPALLALGLRAGDRVAAFIPNMPEAGMLALAALSQGIVWSSCSPDFGSDGVLERFGQIEPKVLFCADGYRYNS